MSRIITLLFLCFLLTNSLVNAQDHKVLIFTKTAGFRHASIPKAVKVVSDLLNTNGIKTLHTEDIQYFDTDSLKKFDAVLFLSTSGTLFNTNQQKALQQFIQSGKGYVGIHAASDTEHDWPWYGQLVGGYFSSHPAIQQAKIDVLNQKHLSTKHLQRVWFHKDEWYDFKNIKPGLNVLMTLDETSYQGGKMGKFHPIAWFQEFDGGRSFYTGLGHTDEAYDSEKFLKHIVGGVKYVLQIKK